MTMTIATALSPSKSGNSFDFCWLRGGCHADEYPFFPPATPLRDARP